MEYGHITREQITGFARRLREEERSGGMVENYTRSVREFAAWLGAGAVEAESAGRWKDALLERGLVPSTGNNKLAALNRFFRFLGWEGCAARPLRLQKRLFRAQDLELSRAEYGRLLSAARNLGRERLYLLMEAVCATGIRVSEVKYLTVEAARRGRAEISLKGKIRTILIPGKLCKKLLQYARAQKTASGEIFLTRSGRSISRKQIWAEMKGVCRAAGVAPSKVFPHNLRHLFARTFYQASRDVVRLADVLGHSSVETTRIYLISTGAEHARQLARLGLIS